MCSPLCRHQKATERTYSPTVIVLFLPFSVNKDLHNEVYGAVRKLAKFPHSPILYYACRSLLTENNEKNNATAAGLCTVFVVFWWRDKGLHTSNRMHNEVWGCAEI